MNKLTKLLSVFVIAGAVGTGTAFASGCGHKHSFSGDWTPDGANGHYHAATCEHTDEKDGYTEHKYGDDLICDDCGYDKAVHVSGVTLDITSKSLKVGETVTLTATVAPDGASNKTVIFSSSDETVATVSTAGVVTAKKEGTATITAASEDDSTKKATCALTVTAAGTVEPDDPTTQIKVSFNLNGHGAGTIADAVADKDGKITAPAAPTDADYNFLGWTLKDSEEVLDLATETFRTATTLYAKWEAKEVEQPGEQLTEDEYKAAINATVSANNFTIAIADMTAKVDDSRNAISIEGDAALYDATAKNAYMLSLITEGIMGKSNLDGEFEDFTAFKNAVLDFDGITIPAIGQVLLGVNFANDVTFNDETGAYTITISDSGSSDTYVTVKFVGGKIASMDFGEFTIKLSAFGTTEADVPNAAKVYENVAFTAIASRRPAGVKLDTNVMGYGLYAKANTETDYVAATEKGFAQTVKQGGDGQETIISLQLLKGDIEGYFELSTDALGRTWDIIQFIGGGAKKFCVNMCDTNGNLKYNIGNSNTDTSQTASPNAEATFKMAVNTAIKVEYKLAQDETSKKYKLTLTIDGNAFVTDFELDTTEMDRIVLPASNIKNGPRKLTINNVIVCGTEMTVADYLPIAQAKLDSIYYGLVGKDAVGTEGEEGYVPAIVGTHTRNEKNITSDYREIDLTKLTEIYQITNVIQNFENIKTAYSSDAQIKEALDYVNGELTKWKEQAANYTKEENVGRFENLTTLPEDVANATDAQAIRSYYDGYEGEGGVRAELEALPTDAQIEFNAAKNALADLKDKLAEKAAEAETTENADVKAAVEAAIAEANEDIAKLEANETYTAEEVAHIAEVFMREYDAAQALANGLQGAKEDGIEDLRAFATAKKAGYAILEEAIDEAVTNGTNAINSIDEEDFQADKKAVTKAVNAAMAAIYKLMLGVDLDALKEAEVSTNNAKCEEDIAQIYADGKNNDAITTDTAYTAAINAVQKAVSDRKEALYASSITVSLDDSEGNAVDELSIKYGTVLTPSNITVIGKRVVSATCEGAPVTEEAGVTVYDALTLVVTVDDIPDFEGNIAWRPVAGVEASEEFVNNKLFTLNNTGAYNSDSVAGRRIDNITFNASTSITVDKAGGTNEATPFIVTVNYELSTLKVYLSLCDTAGTGNNRCGKIYCVTDKGEPVEIKKLASNGDMSIAYNASNVKKGTILKFYAVNDNSSSGGRLHLYGIDAAIDETKVEKEVSITWTGYEDALTETYRYYEVVNLPKTDPVDGEKRFLGWYYTVEGVETKYEGGEKFHSGTSITFTPKFLSNNVTLKFTVEGQDEPVEELFALPEGAKGVEPAIADPSKEGNYFLGWTENGATLFDFTQVSPDADISVMKTIELSPLFVAHETITSTQTVVDTKEADFEAMTQATNKPSLANNVKLTDWLTLVTKGSSVTWKNSSSDLGLNTKGGTFEIVVNEAVTLSIVYYSTSSGRKFTLTKVGDETFEAITEEANTWSVLLDSDGAQIKDTLGKALKGKDFELAAGTYQIVFDTTGDHKVHSISISTSEEKEVIGVVQGISAKVVESATVVEAVMLYNNVEYTVTLTEDQYTVVDGLVIYGAGKSAADAHKYNSCPAPAAPEAPETPDVTE